MRLTLTATAIVLTIAAGASASPMTALDDYVAAPDPTYSYSYNPANTIAGPGYTAYRLDMRSQTWRSAPSEVDRDEWQHWVTVIVPDTVDTTNSFLFVTGGSASTIPPPIPSLDGGLVSLALESNAVTVQLRTVPNQRLTFSDETSSRVEDEIIAYTFDKYMDNPTDEEWPLLLPMVKSTVRAMDTTQDFIDDITGGSLQIDDFTVSGASKRGWTTWLTAAVDDRVSAIAPLVFDALNFEEQLPNHVEQYQDVTAFTVEGQLGRASVAVHDYVDLDIFYRMLNTPEGQDLLQIVDPYSYLDRLDMPKYIINSAGDEFFVPDSSQFYFGELLGENYLRYVPNSGHGLNASALDDLIDFYNAYVDGAAFPEYTWVIDPNGKKILVNTLTGTLLGVNLWQSTNLAAQDFRNAWTSTVWTSSALSPSGLDEYMASVARPSSGATAFFIELLYEVNGTQIAFTTDVSVVTTAPEPASWALLAFGGVVVLGVRRRRRAA